MTSCRRPFLRVPPSLAALLAASAIACAPPAPPPPTTGEIAEGYVRVALQLAQHDPGLVDEWRGSDAWKPGPRQPVAPILARIETLRRNLTEGNGSAAADADRRAYLAGQLTALEMIAQRLLGESTAFDEEAHRAFGVSATHADAARVTAAREALSRDLPGPGSLGERLAGFKKHFAVPADRAEAVVRIALSACRTVTLRAIALPPDEGVELRMVSGMPWDGYTHYLGNHRSRIDINTAGGLDITRALHLACHEGYPGHHVQNVLIDDGLVNKGWDEFLLTPAFGPHVLVTEGAAEAATDLAFPSTARAALYRDVLLPAIGLPGTDAPRLVRVEDALVELEPLLVDVVREYLDNAITQAIALDRLRDEALTPDPDGLLAFAERRRTRVLAYPAGRARMRSVIGSGLAGVIHVFGDRPFALQ